MTTIRLCENLTLLDSGPGTATHGDEAPGARAGHSPAAGPEVLVLAAAPSSTAPTAPVLVTDEATLRCADGSTVIDTSALEDLLPSLGFLAAQDSVARIPVSAVRPEAGRQAGDSLRTVLVVGLGSAWNQAEAASTGTSGSLACLPTDDSPALGEDQPGLLRRAAGRAARALSGTRRAALALPAQDGARLRSVCEGVLLGAYTWDAAGSAPDPAGDRRPLPRARQTTEAGTGRNQPEQVLEQLTVLSPLACAAEGQTVLDSARVVSQATNLARDLVNEPPNRLTPEVLADRATDLARETSLDARTWDLQELREGGLGGLVGVGQGSEHPPVLVRLRWDPPGASSHVALVGKGITFDSGGLSLKPPASMPEMKSDMAGAAAVLAAVVAAARLALPVRVTAWLALAENMPGAAAQRPGDIITIVDGTTVEVTNTDAEGRLVMADALAMATAEEPDAVLDVATLTGAQVVALGDQVAGVMGTPALREQVLTAARRAGEAFWPMPLPTSLRSALDTPAADLRNAKVGSRSGGMLTAGLFLREFVGSTPWAHLDIAGPAFNSSQPWGLTPAGGTGASVATLVELLRLRGEQDAEVPEGQH